MTIIIAADLSDGRKVMLADGKLTSNHGGIADLDCTKIERVEVTFKKRRGLIGSAGSAAGNIILRKIALGYMQAPEPQVDDLYYRVRDMDDDSMEDCNHLMWLPNQQDGHDMIEIDGHGWPRIIKQHFWATGSGGGEARAALLGLAFAQQPDCGTTPYEFSLTWKPTERDLWIAYEVACASDVHCGGKSTLLSL